MDERIEKYLAKLEVDLLNAEKKLIIISSDWAKSFPTVAGVYIVREEGEICYVGETGNICGRMKDLLETRNHTLRRKIGEFKFSSHEDFEKASASKKFPLDIEGKLNRILEDNFEVSAIAVAIGRKELEERIIEKFNPIYNTKEKRKSGEGEKSYSVAEIRNNQPNAYKAWSKGEDSELYRLDKEGKSIKELASIFGRKRGAISSRLRKIKEEKK